MATNAYILFPEDEDLIFDIIKEQDIFDTYTKEMASLLTAIHGAGIKTHYDSENAEKYFNTCILWDETKNIKKGCNIIRIFLTKKSVDVNSHPLRKSDCKYVLWNFDKCPIVNDNPHKLLVEITEHKYTYDNDECLLINVNKSIDSCRNVLLTFKDAKHIKDYPAPFVHIPYVVSQGELDLWLKTNHIKTFSLFDKSRFQRTGRTYDAKPIFQEITTGNYWYLDNLHKDEYEVFNPNCTHIGTANLEGNINPNSQVNGRRITL